MAAADTLTVTLLSDSDLSRGGADVLEAASLTRTRLARAGAGAESPLHIGQRPASTGSPVGAGVPIGDAASAWDPLSGSGVTRALVAARRAARDVLADPTEQENSANESVADDSRVHNAERRRFYGAETRWASRLFWRRRRAGADARAALVAPWAVLAPRTPSRETLAPAEAWLSPALTRRLVASCDAHRPAHLVLGDLRNDRAYPGDTAAFFGLQALIASGALHEAA